MVNLMFIGNGMDRAISRKNSQKSLAKNVQSKNVILNSCTLSISPGLGINKSVLNGKIVSL